MDVERAIQFILDSQAKSEARHDKAEARNEKAMARLDRMEKLTLQLIGLMSQQTEHHAKLSRETDRRFRETDERLKEMTNTINTLGKKIDAFVSASLRTNGHPRKKNGKS